MARDLPGGGGFGAVGERGPGLQDADFKEALVELSRR
jgi:hypothetical protein